MQAFLLDRICFRRFDGSDEKHNMGLYNDCKTNCKVMVKYRMEKKKERGENVTLKKRLIN